MVATLTIDDDVTLEVIGTPNWAKFSVRNGRPSQAFIMARVQVPASVSLTNISAGRPLGTQIRASRTGGSGATVLRPVLQGSPPVAKERRHARVEAGHERDASIPPPPCGQPSFSQRR
jgi:hypothetical protein